MVDFPMVFLCEILKWIQSPWFLEILFTHGSAGSDPLELGSPIEFHFFFDKIQEKNYSQFLTDKWHLGMFYLFNEIISQFFHVKFPCLWVSFIYAMAESWLKIPTRGIVINPPIRVYIGHSKDSHSFMMTIAHDLSSYHTISCCWLSHPNYTHDVPIF